MRGTGGEEGLEHLRQLRNGGRKNRTVAVEHLGGGNAERVLCGAIERADPAARVEGDDAARDGLEDARVEAAPSGVVAHRTRPRIIYSSSRTRRWRRCRRTSAERIPEAPW